MAAVFDNEAPLLSSEDSGEPDVEAAASAKKLEPADGAKGGGTVETAAKTAMAALNSIPITHAELPLFITFVASFVLLFAVGGFYQWGTYGTNYASYALSVACVPLALSFVSLVLLHFFEEAYENHCRWLNMFIFLWSFVGAFFLTMKEPFTVSCNGYFAAWGIVLGSAMSIGVTISALGAATRGVGPLMGAVMMSLVLIVATISPIKYGHQNMSEAVYAMVLSCLTIIFALGVAASNKQGVGSKVINPRTYFAALTAFTVCWIVMAFLTTFRGPFLATGNGYFASWVGMLMMCLTAFIAKQDLDRKSVV